MTLAEATILVVDDEPVLRMTFSILLKQVGATVHTAANGVEALDVLARERIDVMLTDKQMPVMDGHALLEALHKRGDAVPSILFVNGANLESPEDLKRLGVIQTVTKPLHPAQLKHVLEEALATLPVSASPEKAAGFSPLNQATKISPSGLGS